MAKTRILSGARLREIIRYYPETREFEWIERKRGRRLGRFTLGTGRKYPHIIIEGVDYDAHRIAWLWMTGEYPESGFTIDHKTRDTRDYRWENLRLATPSQQMQNRFDSGRNTSGHTGVCWDKNRRKWLVRVGKKHIGRFDSFEEAVAVREKASAEEFGEFKPIGRPRRRGWSP